MANILIVEDESIVAWDIKETLEKLGHNVVALVVSGTAAIQVAAREHPDLVLMDIRLIGDMDGITAGDEIYRQLAIPVVYLTAHADELTLARATKTDPFGYIIKPFQSQTLQSTIKVALQRYQREAATNRHQARLINMLNSVGNGMIITDCQGLVTFINPIAEDLTGWHSSEALGQDISQIFNLIWETDGTAIENPSMRAMRLQEPVKSPDRCWLMSKYNLEIPISDLATTIFNLDGEILGSVVMFQDNTEQLTTQIELWEQNQDLEFFQSQLISQLQEQTGEFDLAIACIQILNLVLDRFDTAHNEAEVLQMAIEHLGTIVKADYSWVALHDSQDSIATIVSEYIDRVDRIVPTSKIGNQIDISLYPEFYNHLFDNESWIDPPEAIIPKPYLNLLTPTAQLLICPIMVDPLDRDWVSGEVGILTTGKSPWTASQALLITQTLNYAVKIFRQTHRQVLDRKSLALSLAWLNSLQADFRSSIADVNRDLHIAAQMLKQEIDSIDRKTENLAAIEDRQSLHRELSVNLQIVQTQWHRKFQLIDALIDIRANGTTFQIQSLSDIQFDRWIADVVGRCSDLAAHYRQEIGYQMVSESITPILLCPFPILELIILELVHNVCKYTPPDRLIILEIDIRDHQLQLSVIGVGTEKSARKLEKIFLSFANNSLDLSWQSDITSLGLTLVNKLVPLIDSELGFNRDRGEIRLILNVPLQ